MLEKHFKSQQYYTNEFYHACINGDFELAACLLKMGVNLNVKFEHGQNLLHIACMKNFYGLVQLLIKFGCNEFLKDNYGRTALHYAAFNNSTSITRYLVEKNTFSNNNNTDILTKDFLNCQDTDGKTAIHLAVEKNCKEPIMIILSSGLADLNIEDNSQKSALTIAYSKKYWDIFELLVKSGSNLSRYCLKDICVQGDVRALNILLRYFDPKSLASIIEMIQSDPKKNSYLYLAMKYSHNLEFVIKLFEIGLKINSKDLKDYYSEVKSAVKMADTDISKFNHYLECFILMIKHKCFNTTLIKYPNILSLFNSYEQKIEINFDHKNNILNHCIMLYLNLFFEYYSNISEKNKDLEQVKLRILYLFALCIYSSQLDIKKKFVQKWFGRKFTRLNSFKMSNNDSIRENVQEIYKESISNPWSLQMLCRAKIKNDLNNIDYVLNDKNLIKSFKIPNICIRYLKYEFI